MQPHRRLEMMRKSREIPKDEVADFLIKSRNTLIAYEKGKSAVPITVFARLAKLYGCRVFDIYGVNEENVIYDIPREEFLKLCMQLRAEEKRRLDEANGIFLPDEYYSK